MTEEFDFSNDSSDVRTYSDASYVQSTKAEYKARARRYAKIGVVLLFAPFLIFIVIFIPLGEFADLAFL